MDNTDKSYVANAGDETFEAVVEPSVTALAETFFNEEKYMYLVFWSKLESLLLKIRCPQDNRDAPEDCIKKHTRGSCLDAKVYCVNGHVALSWSSQPELGKMPAGNFLFAGSLLFSGTTYTTVAHMATLMNMHFISDTTFYMVQSRYLIQQINDMWYRVKRELFQELATKQLYLAGDGRCDSPGYSAKYCTYSLLDQSTSKIIEIQQVQKTETDNKSTRMEVLAFERAMDSVIAEGLTVAIIATDRHTSIRKLARKKYKPMGIVHEFDVYHLCNSVRKDMKEKGNRKGCKELFKWMKFLNNHLWYSARCCKGDPDLLVEIHCMVLHHRACSQSTQISEKQALQGMWSPSLVSYRSQEKEMDEERV